MLWHCCSIARALLGFRLGFATLLACLCSLVVTFFGLLQIVGIDNAASDLAPLEDRRRGRPGQIAEKRLGGVVVMAGNECHGMDDPRMGIVGKLRDHLHLLRQTSIGAVDHARGHPMNEREDEDDEQKMIHRGRRWLEESGDVDHRLVSGKIRNVQLGGHHLAVLWRALPWRDRT